MTEPQKQYITPETKKALEEDLKGRMARRESIAAEINERREEGDLKENAGYDAAREMQDQNEAEIMRIQKILMNSTTERPDGLLEGVTAVGCVVHVFYNDDESDTETFLVGTRAKATENQDLETYSELSPVGAAVLGLSAGESREYTAPNGRTIKVTVKTTEPYDSAKYATPRGKD